MHSHSSAPPRNVLRSEAAKKQIVKKKKQAELTVRVSNDRGEIKQNTNVRSCVPPLSPRSYACPPLSRIFSQFQNESLDRTLASGESLMLVDLRTAPDAFRSAPFPLEHEPDAASLAPFDEASALRTLPVSESRVDVREPLRDLGSEPLLLLPDSRLPPVSLLRFLQDCAECGLPGESPLRLRAEGAGLCLPPEGGLGAA